MPKAQERGSLDYFFNFEPFSVHFNGVLMCLGLDFSHFGHVFSRKIFLGQ